VKVVSTFTSLYGVSRGSVLGPLHFTTSVLSFHLFPSFTTYFVLLFDVFTNIFLVLFITRGQVNLPMKVKSFLVMVVDKTFRDMRWSAMTGETTLLIHRPTYGRVDNRPFCQ